MNEPPIIPLRQRMITFFTLRLSQLPQPLPGHRHRGQPAAVPSPFGVTSTAPRWAHRHSRWPARGGSMGEAVLPSGF
jgi:hypothetical protein